MSYPEVPNQQQEIYTTVYYRDPEDNNTPVKLEFGVPVVPVHRMLDHPVPPGTNNDKSISFLYDDLGRVIHVGTNLSGLYHVIHKNYAMYSAKRATWAGVVYPMGDALTGAACQHVERGLVHSDYDEYDYTSPHHSLDFAGQRGYHHVAVWLKGLIGKSIINDQVTLFDVGGLYVNYLTWCSQTFSKLITTGLDAQLTSPASLAKHLDLAHGLTPKAIQTTNADDDIQMWTPHGYQGRNYRALVVGMTVNTIEGL